jgi:hypothetical protein
MGVWFVYLDAVGKYHAWREDTGFDLPGEAMRSAVTMASAELQRAHRPWVRDSEKAVESWALEAPSRYQALKLCRMLHPPALGLLR